MDPIVVKNLILVVTEIVIIFSIFSVASLLVHFLFEPLMKLPFLKRWQKNAENVEQNLKIILRFSRAFLCLLVALVNGWLVYSGAEDLQEYTFTLIKNIPPEFWRALVLGIVKTTLLLWLVSFTLPYLHRLLDLACHRVQNMDEIQANDESIADLFDYFKSNFTKIIWLFAMALCSQFLRLPEIIAEYLYIGCKIYLIFVAGKIALQIKTVLVDTLDGLSHKYSSPKNILRFYDRLRHLVPLTRKCLEFVIYIVTASLAVRQIELIAGIAEYAPQALSILGIFFASRIFEEVVNLFLEEVMLADQDKIDILDKQRRLTMLPLLKSFVKYFVYFTSAIFILNTVGIDPTPILAGAGILGLAIGMGAQTLLQDMVAGMFVLFENYYLVGDFVEINDIRGFVTAIELRTTRVTFKERNYIIPNGEIRNIINYSKEFSSASVEIGVAYTSDLNVVYKVLEKLALYFQDTYEEVIEPTKIKGVNEFGEYQILIKTSTKVKPGTQRKMERIFRKTIKEVFDRKGIEMPYMSPEDL
ncbi:MAG: mechanosensitive ion channel family protein [Cyanobacteriota bacterium]|nr:mechanosensitive ion channel family protein [Cyanobacteriota bacterium]